MLAPPEIYHLCLNSLGSRNAGVFLPITIPITVPITGNAVYWVFPGNPLWKP